MSRRRRHAAARTRCASRCLRLRTHFATLDSIVRLAERVQAVELLGMLHGRGPPAIHRID
jgi:hypothetical protein